MFLTSAHMLVYEYESMPAVTPHSKGRAKEWESTYIHTYTYMHAHVYEVYQPASKSCLSSRSLLPHNVLTCSLVNFHKLLVKISIYTYAVYLHTYERFIKISVWAKEAPQAASTPSLASTLISHSTRYIELTYIHMYIY